MKHTGLMLLFDDVLVANFKAFIETCVVNTFTKISLTTKNDQVCYFDIFQPVLSPSHVFCKTQLNSTQLPDGLS